MTRKDFVIIAAAIAAARRDIIAKELEPCHVDLLDGVGYATDHMIDALAKANPAFDKERFRAACEA